MVKLISGARKVLDQRMVFYGRLYEVILLLCVVVLIAWQSLGSIGILPAQFFSSPLLIVTTFIDLVQSGEMTMYLQISLTRALLGFALCGFFPLYLQTFLGLRNVDKKLYNVARILEIGRLEQITKLMIQSVLQNILLGIRLALSAAWMCLVVAELLGADRGGLHDPGCPFIHANGRRIHRHHHFCSRW
ncbi:ABC transporter permease [Peribacillus sp. NPDC006672]|uniref:ABC transporter permease n=1 Tax=Peribacillus sp. NPDC006672 TaxID=3390606 RepID=UPI003CFDC9EC